MELDWTYFELGRDLRLGGQERIHRRDTSARVRALPQLLARGIDLLILGRPHRRDYAARVKSLRRTRFPLQCPLCLAPASTRPSIVSGQHGGNQHPGCEE